MSKDLYISASSIKVFKGCSLRYYYNKIVQVPEDTNQGALSGGIVHECLEYLLKPRRHAHAKEIIAKGELSPSLKYFLIKRCTKVGVTEEKMQDTEQMVLNALALDFLCEGGEVLGTEIEFKIESEKPRYKIKGYIDLLVKYGNTIICRDYKSQKNPFTDEELKKNYQGFMYTIAGEHLYPGHKVKEVQFLMLKFLGEKSVQVFKCNKKQMDEFKRELALIYSEMEQFDASRRFDNVARYQEPPEDGSFGGKLMCGFGFKPGQLKKDGTLMYACPMKWATEYYELHDKGGELLRTSLSKKELEKELKDGRFIVTKQHEGCEVWR